jgi:uncharacterized membrane protein
MLTLILGILVFLGAHTFTTFREARAGLIQQYGLNAFKAAYSVVSLLGFILIVWGFARYRADDWVQVWTPPVGTRHLTIALMWFAFVALACMNPAPGRIRGWLRHPMLVAIKIWALAHLLANGDLGGMILFGSFLAWAIYDRIAVKRRGDLGAPRQASFTQADIVALVVGTVAYIAMIFLHPYLIGVPVLM